MDRHLKVAAASKLAHYAELMLERVQADPTAFLQSDPSRTRISLELESINESIAILWDLGLTSKDMDAALGRLESCKKRLRALELTAV